MILSASTVSSPPHLSLAAAHHRSWRSLHAVLRHGHTDREVLRDLLAHQRLEAISTALVPTR